MPQPFQITETAKTRILSHRADQADDKAYLRILIEGGGCSGFQYKMDWVSSPAAAECIIDDVVVSDAVSMPYLEGAVLDFAKTLMGEDFSIKNPNATSSCGCGTSFSVD